MFLIVGLGNPGINYQYTRHNVGFMAADSLVSRHNFSSFSNSKKFSAEISEGSLFNERILLVKPYTFMNLSGESVQKIINFYKLELNKVIVIHDDLDIDFSKIKFKIGGGHGGHNGLRSIDACVGKNYQRIRIGIGRPESKEDVSSYVLCNFTKHEQLSIDILINKTTDNLHLLIKGETDKFLQNIK